MFCTVQNDYIKTTPNTGQQHISNMPKPPPCLCFCILSHIDNTSIQAKNKTLYYLYIVRNVYEVGSRQELKKNSQKLARERFYVHSCGKCWPRAVILWTYGSFALSTIRCCSHNKLFCHLVKIMDHTHSRKHPSIQRVRKLLYTINFAPSSSLLTHIQLALPTNHYIIELVSVCQLVTA